jgi:hypothetical protein
MIVARINSMAVVPGMVIAAISAAIQLAQIAKIG